MGKFGLPFVQNAIAAIQNHAQTHAAAGHDTAGAVANQANALAAVVAQETGRLGLASDVHGIQRRGAEVHIDIATVP